MSDYIKVVIRFMYNLTRATTIQSQFAQKSMNHRGPTLTANPSLRRMILIGIILFLASIPMDIAMGAKPAPFEYPAISTIQDNRFISKSGYHNQRNANPDHSEPVNPRFEHFSIPEGLPSSSIRTITQDSIGFLWIATLNGLSRFDGYQFTNYQIDPGNTEILSFVEINTVYTDRQGDLWVGSSQGLSFYDQEASE
ncbi:MAG: hypothetical protein JSV69_09190, partial [Chloroflexota bacterium]